MNIKKVMEDNFRTAGGRNKDISAYNRVHTVAVNRIDALQTVCGLVIPKNMANAIEREAGPNCDGCRRGY